MDLWQWFQSQPSNQQMLMLCGVALLVSFFTWQLISMLRNCVDWIFNRGGDDKVLKDLMEVVEKVGDQTTQRLEELVLELHTLNGLIGTSFEWFQKREDNKDRETLTKLLQQLPDLALRKEAKNA